MDPEIQRIWERLRTIGWGEKELADAVAKKRGGTYRPQSVSKQITPSRKDPNRRLLAEYSSLIPDAPTVDYDELDEGRSPTARHELRAVTVRPSAAAQEIGEIVQLLSRCTAEQRVRVLTHLRTLLGII